MDTVIALATQQHIVLLGAEAVPWRCHRGVLIADALTARRIHVEPILSTTRRQAQALTPWAPVDGRRLTDSAESG